ncbi:hypothetical protein OnM2_078051 [Erysiphe neolycopersici]|uniref:Uncharacterized protein n=1 Tax=Erysiphe neolycopersici TaxID=212602 RepID=A0A420HHA7_9PEZI|nr:hypothetical protein OnM2_078051 [Erysiphe neolycopersici]
MAKEQDYRVILAPGISFARWKADLQDALSKRNCLGHPAWNPTSNNAAAYLSTERKPNGRNIQSSFGSTQSGPLPVVSG